MSLKSLRRSLNSKDHKDSPNISTPIYINPISKPSSSVLPPQKVIRALHDHKPSIRAPQELQFNKGDFFFVIDEIQHNGDPWYEAHNPVNGSRGLVPRSAFEAFNKGNNATRTSTYAGPGAKSPAIAQPTSPPPRQQIFYAIVQYDFTAERPDELDAKAGEPISVVAQSNREWFVAKPIGRLGGPGLIPVAFVEIRDPATGRKMDDDEVEKLMDRGDLPKVEQWKKATLDYKASSIPLGVIDATPAPENSYPDKYKSEGYARRSRSASPSSGPPSPRDQRLDVLPPGLWVSARIPSFHFESGDYWFRLNIEYQPDFEPPNPRPPVITYILYRNYEDFYAFQLELLNTWPVEAGREKRHPDDPPLTDDDRIMPYMPGPLDHVDDGVTAGRQRDLDIYVQELVQLASPQVGAEYVLRCDLVRQFLSQKAGDIVVSSGAGFHSQTDDLVEELDAMRMETENDRRISGASDYSAQEIDRGNDPTPQQGHNPRALSTASSGRGPMSASSSEYYPKSMSTNSYHPYGNGSTSSFHSNQMVNDRPPSSAFTTSQTSPTRSQAPRQPPTGRSTTPSSIAPTTMSNGADGQSSSFLKIKIFHSSTDDLIAIRVNPRVTFSQLLAKVRDRLGADVQSLKYRDSLPNGGGNKSLRDIDDDDDLREWVSTNSKLVLFAN